MPRPKMPGDCPFCGVRKYCVDACFVEDQEVWHYRCHNCDKEWVE